MTTCTIPMKDCTSKQLRRYGYDAERGVLAIQFVQGKERDKTSRPYEYPCTPEQFAALDQAESKGGHFNANLKSSPFTKVVETDEERAARKQVEAQAA